MFGAGIRSNIYCKSRIMNNQNGLSIAIDIHRVIDFCDNNKLNLLSINVSPLFFNTKASGCLIMEFRLIGVYLIYGVYVDKRGYKGLYVVWGVPMRNEYCRNGICHLRQTSVSHTTSWNRVRAHLIWDYVFNYCCEYCLRCYLIGGMKFYAYGFRFVRRLTT